MIGNIQAGSYVTFTTSKNVLATDGKLLGIFVGAASSTPTITIYDSATTTTTTPVVAVFTPVAGTYYPLPFALTAGCYIVTSGTVAGTASVVAG